MVARAPGLAHLSMNDLGRSSGQHLHQHIVPEFDVDLAHSACEAFLVDASNLIQQKVLGTDLFLGGRD
jgi:hypothetical protein